jgi:hypothetical protein
VLGRIDLAGAGRIERSKSIELIVYLALHPQGVTPDELWEALWPDRPVNRGTLHTTVTAARTGLGRAPDGTRYLPDAHDGHYRLSPPVGLDWARFHALITQGEGDGPDELEALRSALELVRGVPLTSPTGRGYEWAVVHRTEMETVIAEVAERLACATWISVITGRPTGPLAAACWPAPMTSGCTGCSCGPPMRQAIRPASTLSGGSCSACSTPTWSWSTTSSTPRRSPSTPRCGLGAGPNRRLREGRPLAPRRTDRAVVR